MRIKGMVAVGLFVAGGAGAVTSCSAGNDSGGTPAPDASADSSNETCGDGFRCVPAPQGWTVGVFRRDIPESNCPDDYGNALRLAEPSQNTHCTCTCFGTGTVTCDPTIGAQGNDPLVVYVGTGDAGCASGATQNLGSGCVPFAASAGSSLTFQQIPGSLSSCDSQLVATSHHTVDQVCGATTMRGGCGPGSTCVAVPPANWSIAAFRQSDLGGCPLPWVDFLQHDGGSAASLALATGWDDSVACSSCNCGPDPKNICTNPTLALFTDSSCTTEATSVASQVCATLPADVHSARYSATPEKSGCTPAQPSQPTGIEPPMQGAGYVVCIAQ